MLCVFVVCVGVMCDAMFVVWLCCGLMLLCVGAWCCMCCYCVVCRCLYGMCLVCLRMLCGYCV